MYCSLLILLLAKNQNNDNNQLQIMKKLNKMWCLKSFFLSLPASTNHNAVLGIRKDLYRIRLLLFWAYLEIKKNIVYSIKKKNYGNQLVSLEKEQSTKLSCAIN